MPTDQELERLTTFRLSDAMRLGSQVTKQEYGWGNGETACALSSAVIGGKAAKYL